MPGTKKICKYCGKTTYENTTGTPNAPCPERGGGMLGQHVYTPDN